MACFAFDDPENPKYLYAVNEKEIYAFNIANSENPAQCGTASGNGGTIETIFVRNGRLFLGTPSGNVYVFPK